MRYLVDLIHRCRITTFFGVPTMFHFLATLDDIDRLGLGSLCLIAYAGSPMPTVTIQRLREIFPNIWLHNFFGLTETISMTHVLFNADAEQRPESIGKLLPHVRQRIHKADGREAQAGEVGELHFHRDNIIRGYWKEEPDRLAESIQGDWFNTGDLAVVDAEGYVVLKGRSKDLIITGS